MPRYTLEITIKDEPFSNKHQAPIIMAESDDPNVIWSNIKDQYIGKDILVFYHICNHDIGGNCDGSTIFEGVVE